MAKNKNIKKPKQAKQPKISNKPNMEASEELSVDSSSVDFSSKKSSKK